MNKEEQYSRLVELCERLLAADERGQELRFVEVMRKIKKEVDATKPNMTPKREDTGRWVEVRDSDNHEWEGPFLLARVDPTDPSLFYQAVDLWWRQARIIPGVARITMKKHDGTEEKPDWLNDEDELLVEYQSHVKAVRTARNANWGQVYYYQKLEVKFE